MATVFVVVFVLAAATADANPVTVYMKNTNLKFVLKIRLTLHCLYLNVSRFKVKREKKKRNKELKQTPFIYIYSFFH